MWPDGGIVRRSTANGAEELSVPRPRFYVADGSRTTFDIFLTPHRNMGSLKPVTVGKFLYGSYKDVEIYFISKRKLRISSPNMEVINELARNRELNDKFCTFIPSECCEVKGVVPIPSEYTEEEIFKEAFCKNLSKFGPVPDTCGISEVRRFSRTDPKKREVRYNLDSVLVSFSGRVLPSHVNIGGVNYPVSPFREKVIQCSKCWHFGHQERSCTRPQKLCKLCACGHADDVVCTSQPKCVNCGGNHLSSSADCPVLLKLKKAKLEKANKTKPQTISFTQSTSSNLQPFNYVFNSSHFPALGAPKKRNSPQVSDDAVPIRAAKRVRSQEDSVELSETSTAVVVDVPVVMPTVPASVAAVSTEIKKAVNRQIKLADENTMSVIKPFFKSILETVKDNRDYPTNNKNDTFKTIMSLISNLFEENDEDLSA